MTERLLPASGIQRQFWLAQELQRETTAYHIATLWCIRGRLKLESLWAAFEQLCRRHEGLRTTFEERETTLYQVIHSDLTPEFCVEHRHVEVGGVQCERSSSARSTWCEARSCGFGSLPPPTWKVSWPGRCTTSCATWPARI